MKKNHRSKIILFIIAMLFVSSIFNNVIADYTEEDYVEYYFSEYPDDVCNETFEEQGLSIRLVALGLSPRRVEIGETATLSFTVEFTASGWFYSTTDWQVEVFRDVTGTRVVHRIGSHKKNDPSRMDFTHTITESRTRYAQEEPYTIKLSVKEGNSFVLKEVRTTTLTVQDTKPSYSIDVFGISPSSINSGEPIKGTITVSGKNIPIAVPLLFVYLVDASTNNNICLLLPRISRTTPTFSSSFTLPNSQTTFPDSRTGSITIKAQLRVGGSSVVSERQASVTIRVVNPNNPIKSIFPSSGNVNELLSFSTRVTHPSGTGINCQIRYNMGNGEITPWRDIPSGGFDTLSYRYTQEGTYTVTAQARNKDGATTTSWVTLGTVSVTLRPADIVVSFTPRTQTIKRGEEVRLEWDVQNADEVKLNGATVQSSGHETVQPPIGTHVYTLSASGIGKTTVTQTSTIIVQDSEQEKTTVSISADKTSINPGERVVLTWSSTNAHTVTINGESVELSNSMEVFPLQTTTYEIRGEGDIGSDTKSIQISVSGTGGGSAFEPTITLVVKTGGKVDSQGRPYIEPGSVAILQWYSTNAHTIAINNDVVTNNAASGSFPVSPPLTTTYEAVAVGHGGESRATVTLLVQYGPPDEKEEGINIDTIIIIAIGIIILAIVGYYLYKDHKSKQDDSLQYMPGSKKKDNFFSKILKRKRKPSTRKPETPGKKKGIFSRLLKRGKKKKNTQEYFENDSAYNIDISHDDYDYFNDDIDYLDIFRSKKKTVKRNTNNVKRNKKKVGKVKTTKVKRKNKATARRHKK